MVPWRPEEQSRYDSVDIDHRDRLWAYCRAWWHAAFPDVEIVEGSSPGGPFNRSAAINDAAFGYWDVGIVADADVVCDPAQVRQAIALAIETERVVLPYSAFRGLTPHMTARALAGDRAGWDRGVRYRSDVHESSVVVIPRQVWMAVGGFDERFVGWGQEDVAFIQAARVLTGSIERTPGVVWHLWHPRGVSRDRSMQHYRDNQALGQRYRDTHTEQAMRSLLAERGAMV